MNPAAPAFRDVDRAHRGLSRACSRSRVGPKILLVHGTLPDAHGRGGRDSRLSEAAVHPRGIGNRWLRFRTASLPFRAFGMAGTFQDNTQAVIDTRQIMC